MSDNNDSSSPVIAAAAAASSASTKRSHNEMDNTNNDSLKSKYNTPTTSSNDDDDAIFTSGMERLKLAEAELAQAQQHMEGIRQQIRSKGKYEPDSLLFLGDNNILSCIMNYLTMAEVGRCELVCSVLKKQAIHYWDTLDKLYFTNHDALRSPSADNSHKAVIRYKVASRLAERIGDLKDLLDKHTVISEDINHFISMDRRISGYCEGCELPDLNFEPFRPETSDEYELFVRFCRTSDNKLLAEGFAPHSNEMWHKNLRPQLRLRNLNFSNWPQFAELTRLIETSEGDSFDNEYNNNMLAACMRELTVVVIGVHKGTSKASLSLVQSNFGRPDNPRRYMKYLHNMGKKGLCATRGSMNVKSHGAVETKQIDGETCTVIRNRFCDAGLTIMWDSAGESGECHWTLRCSCRYRQQEY